MQRFAPALGMRFYSLALVRSVFSRRFTALFLIALIASPGIFLSRPAPAKAANIGPVIASAPPEAFTTNYRAASAAGSIALFASAFTGVSNAITSFIAPAVPAGLEAARIPTLSERITSHIQPLLALVATTNSEFRSSPPVLGGVPEALRGRGGESALAAPQPTSVVDFDFDNDGKADIGRWHSQNTEFKVRNSNGGSYSTFTLGSSSAKIAPGDFNGGREDRRCYIRERHMDIQDKSDSNSTDNFIWISGRYSSCRRL